jgi:hypothetical protein|tara:strand:+ start:5830 stop:6954 length:1125 start_codon:yes stop_codon:yes gene_type:complete
MKNKLSILIFFIFLFVISLNGRSHEINTDFCNPDLFTEEVFDVKCSNRAIEFKSQGFPSPNHTMMTGITATNQQIPQIHNYQFHITRTPKITKIKEVPDSGAIGVAVNGIPLFDPATQGPVNLSTGKRPNSYKQGELDHCGGHAGRGDDYHYHIAPVCLIEDLGLQNIDVLKKPIGFSMDGFPILALGWFDQSNNVENDLDECRGMTDSKGQYFYNVKTTSDYDILSCFHAQPQKFAKDSYTMRKDKNNNDIVGDPLKFTIKSFMSSHLEDNQCDRMSGTLSNEVLLQTDGSVQKIKNQDGDIFYCNAGCYGMFFEADKSPNIKGRAMYYDKAVNNCPAGYLDDEQNNFVAYDGPPQSYKAPQSTSKKKQKKKK